MRAKPIDFLEIKIPDYISLSELVSRLKLDRSQVRELNPALTEAVYDGQLLVPAGYFFRIPNSSEQTDKEMLKRQLLERYASIPRPLKHKMQVRSRSKIKMIQNHPKRRAKKI